jgi:hypothetical protein
MACSTREAQMYGVVRYDIEPVHFNRPKGWLIAESVLKSEVRTNAPAVAGIKVHISVTEAAVNVADRHNAL